MSSDLNFRSNLRLMRAKIKGMAQEIQDNKKYLKSHNFKSYKEIDQLIFINQKISLEIRCYLIAYGLIRGLSYSRIEPNCQTYIDPNVIFKIIQNYVPKSYLKNWNLELIKLILGVETTKSTSDVSLSETKENVAGVSSPNTLKSYLNKLKHSLNF